MQQRRLRDPTKRDPMRDQTPRMVCKNEVDYNGAVRALNLSRRSANAHHMNE